VSRTEVCQRPFAALYRANTLRIDLCDERKIRGYPTLNLYRDGEFVEQFKKSRDLEVLVDYVTAHAEKTAPPPVPPPSVPASEDAPPQVTTPRLDYNPDGTVLVLNSHTFAATLAKGPVFVKYYAPWCGHCKKLAPHWTRLAKEMQHKLTIAEVNCEDEKSLCGKQGVPGYPALYFYSATGAKTEYLGGRKLEKLKAFAEKATEP
jgi:thioredoxin domain-containing protein 5